MLNIDLLNFSLIDLNHPADKVIKCEIGIKCLNVVIEMELSDIHSILEQFILPFSRSSYIPAIKIFYFISLF